jgi:pre-mRNA branch site protein p14
MATVRLTPDVQRVLSVRNVPYTASAEDVAELFGRFGAVRQIRLGVEKGAKGSAFVIFDDLFAAQRAHDALDNYHMQDRYIIVRYHRAKK